jgi:hemolysin III
LVSDTSLVDAVREYEPMSHARWLREELANSLTHGFGAALSVIAASVLLSVVWSRGDWLNAIGCTIYGVLLVAVYSASTLSHVVHTPRLRRMFRALDQGVIYLFIAGTYTPVSMAYLRDGWWWWALLAAMWCMALTGFVSKVFLRHRLDAVSTSLYVFMGWVPLVGLKPMLVLIPSEVAGLMLTGGIIYCIGIFFLTNDQRVPYFHSVWHISVILASACHFAGIFWYIAL